jgi:hypothetical protein
MVIPEMAFAPLIKGVCSVGGTFDMSSKPIKLAKAKIKSNNVKSTSIITIPNN